MRPPTVSKSGGVVVVAMVVAGTDDGDERVLLLIEVEEENETEQLFCKSVATCDFGNNANDGEFNVFNTVARIAWLV